VMMPGMDGFQVCQRLKDDPKTAEVPIIFLTAKNESENIAKAFELGAQDYLVKPFNAQELSARVRTHLELRYKTLALQRVNHDLELRVQERTAELKDANRKLAQLDKAKNDFLMLINHELRTPLNGISGFTKILQDSLQSEEYAQLLAMIDESADRLLRLADASLLITNLKAQNYKTDKQLVCVKSLIGDRLQGMAERAAQMGAELCDLSQAEEVLAELDPRLLDNCLEILIDNALRHGHALTRVCLEARAEGPWVVIEVKDDGRGFSKEAIKQLFELFTAAEVSYHSDGFGLGLATAKLIMETLEGDIALVPSEMGAHLRLRVPAPPDSAIAE